MRSIRVFCGVIFLVLMVSVPSLSQTDAIFFDDFDYTRHNDPQLVANGWIVRAGEGWPGVPGAIWRETNIIFRDDPDMDGNRVLQMESSTDGQRVYQTQICHQRKYYEGTYAARVRFSDAPRYGPDGDRIVQTFYLISPQAYDMDPDYSEHDYEYLPNGGWGAGPHTLFATSWETFQLSPWIADNTSSVLQGSLEGWHTLVIQIARDEIHYSIDGLRMGAHDAYYYPEVPMSINFNLWFIDGGLVRSRMLRKYVEQVDWVFHAQDMTLDTAEIESQVAAYREQGLGFVDTVPDGSPPLESPCNF